MQAVAYLRRSRVDTRRPGLISHEQQLLAVRELARRHGEDPDALVVIEDWGRSGRLEKQHLRAGFARLERMVRDGTVSAIYAYSTNRLARSLETLTRLARLCAGIDPRTGKRIEGAVTVPIRVHDGDSPDVTTSNGRLVFNILGSVAEWQADWTRERMEETTAVRRRRGDHLGPAPYGFRVVGGQLVANEAESFDRVLDAYRRGGSLQGAARLLNSEQTRSRNGRPWQASTIRAMLIRNAPDEVPRHAKRGRPAAHVFTLAGLLRCPCNARLTGRHRTRNGAVSYECKRAPHLADHGRPYSVSEDRLLPWVHAEAGLLIGPDKVSNGGEDASARVDVLVSRRVRVVDAFLDGTIDKNRRAAELAAIDRELDRLDASSQIVDVPQIDWGWSAGELNTVLRALWDHVLLDETMRPVSAVWLVPEWRSASSL